MKITIREAELRDVEQLVAVDTSRYGDMSQQIAGDAVEMFRQRILNSHGWFWVAEVDGKIEGLFSSLPVATRIDTFTSWDECTARGTLEGCYDPTSNVLYVVAMTSTERGSELNVADRLLARALSRCVREGLKLGFFAARMPDFRKESGGRTAEEFYSSMILKDGKLVAEDRQIRHYESLGLKRIRLVPAGFPEDLDSCGYSVLFRMDFPFYGVPFSALWAWLVFQLAKSPKVFAFIANHVG